MLTIIDLKQTTKNFLCKANKFVVV